MKFELYREKYLDYLALHNVYFPIVWLVLRNIVLAYNDPEMQIYKLQEEIRFLHEELAKAQNVPRGMAPPQLQHWLQLTHEIELKYFHAKKAAAENQLRKAKDECDKLRRKGQSFMGPFRLTHGGSIDDIDTTILKAK